MLYKYITPALSPPTLRLTFSFQAQTLTYLGALWTPKAMSGSKSSPWAKNAIEPPNAPTVPKKAHNAAWKGSNRDYENSLAPNTSLIPSGPKPVSKP